MVSEKQALRNVFHLFTSYYQLLDFGCSRKEDTSGFCYQSQFSGMEEDFEKLISVEKCYGRVKGIKHKTSFRSSCPNKRGELTSYHTRALNL